MVSKSPLWCPKPEIRDLFTTSLNAVWEAFLEESNNISTNNYKYYLYINVVVLFRDYRYRNSIGIAFSGTVLVELLCETLWNSTVMVDGSSDCTWLKNSH